MSDARRALIVSALTAAGLAAAPAVAAPMTAVTQLEPGLWQLKTGNEPPRNICVADPASLLQLRHAQAACTRLVIDDAATSATVHYSCPGAGWGRTTLRADGAHAARIETQGIAANAPFADSISARRTGDCGAVAASLRRR